MKLPRIDLGSREQRDAARLAIQSAIAAAAMFSLMKAFAMPERFVGVLSAVMVIQPTAGAAIGAAKDRFLATIVGALIGVVCLILLPSGYGTAAALALSMLVMNAIAGFKEEWRYGVVAAVALALGSQEDVYQTALDRSIAIGVGVVVGALVAMAVWPDRAEKRARRSLDASWDALADYLDAAIGSTIGRDGNGQDDARRYRARIEEARGAIENVRLADTDRLKGQSQTTDDIWTAARFLERIGEEADPAKDGTLKDCAEKLSDAASRILKKLSDRDEPPPEAFDAMEEAVRTARDRSSAGPDGGLEGASRGALAFTMGELAEAVRELNEKVSKGGSA